MNITALKTSFDPTQEARAAFMRDLFEPWSYRKMETRTGIGRSSLQSKFAGHVGFSLSDIEALAPLVRMSAAELAIELFSIPETKETPTRSTGGGNGLRYLMEPPTGNDPVTSSLQVNRLPQKQFAETHLAPVTALRA